MTNRRAMALGDDHLCSRRPLAGGDGSLRCEEKDREGVNATSKLAWYPTDQCFIGGRWVAPLSGASLPLEDPSRGVAIGAIRARDGG